MSESLDELVLNDLLIKVGALYLLNNGYPNRYENGVFKIRSITKDNIGIKVNLYDINYKSSCGSNYIYWDTPLYQESLWVLKPYTKRKKPKTK